MAIYSNEGVTISGFSACVPKIVEKNIENNVFSTSEDAKKFIETTGVKERRIAPESICTSDLTFCASNELLSKLKWDSSEIGILICVTQTPDFHGPMNSSIIQYKLGLPKTCIVFDIPIGCSGFIYGSSVISSMMKNIGISKGLLLVGDTLSKQASPRDKSTQPLFGDAGAAIAFSLTNDVNDKIIFDLGGDGSGFSSLYLKDGGYRNPFSEKSLEFYTTAEGLTRNGCHTIMEGMDVFSFGISTAPKTVCNVLEYAGITVDLIDSVVFHQANLYMNEKIRKKLKLTPQQTPYSIGKYGNTSSATIPLTIVSELKDRIQSEKMRLILCGFGIGLSWGTMYLTTNKIVCTDIIEI
jgi:3-oxoacyl-[acyl-carrier-protein] synthase-3